MRIAIISDIHSNLEAFQAVLSEIEKEQVDTILCLGDIVGYGPNPNECIELVQKHCETILIGNHDYACINKSEMFFFNRFARQAIEYTLSVISEENLDFISGLPFSAIVYQYLLVHANPYTPESWDYILSIDDAIFYFSKFKSKICFIGHSHQPIVYYESGDQQYGFTAERELNLDPDKRYIINVGSVGQPRDNNPAAAFGILDTTENHYELIRVGYNVSDTIDKMYSAGLPKFLSDRLLVGK